MSSRLLRSMSILSGVLLAAIVLASWSQPWFVVTLTGQSAGQSNLQVAGDVAAPAISAFAVVSAAAFVAMAISGLFFRVALAVLEVLIGGTILLSAVLAVASPVVAVEAAVTKATSVAGIESVVRLVGSNVATVWPFAAIVAGALLALLGIAIVVTGHRWPVSGRKYQTVRVSPVDPGSDLQNVDQRGAGNRGDSVIADWDELSGGVDPTSR